MRATVLVAVAGMGLGALACSTGKPAADTTSVASVDTMKPAVVAAPDSVAVASTGASTRTKSPATTATKTKSGAAVTARDTTHLGRDSVIKINPRDPKRQIPTKKP
ncbi:MAG TPA: hypothetical protein VJ867_03660 [Gemmatimonadaceae bacterium]|nr:hypothetical protein [Gemmatimonadaceae bacterium]